MKKILIPLFAIILMLGMSTAAFAAVSPSPVIMPDTSVTVDNAHDASFGVKVTVTYDEKDGAYTVSVPATSGDKTFDTWFVIGSEYQVVSGSLTESTVVLKITAPDKTSIVANYKSPEEPTEAPTTTVAPTEKEPKPTKKPAKEPTTKDKGDKGPVNDGPTSPDTGSSVASLGLVALLAAGVAITSKKKQK